MTIWPALWKLSRLSGSRTIKSLGRRSPASLGTKPVTTMTQAAKQSRTWTNMEPTMVERFSGFSTRDSREKTKQPRQKEAMAVLDLAQRYGWLYGWPETPRPT